MSINFDLTDLRTFLALMETGSFHLAGDRLALSQPAVTRRIRKLEETLGTRLFDRTTRSVTPTLAARQLQRRAEAILHDVEDTQRALRDDSLAFDHQRRSLITLAVIPTVVSILIPAAMQRLRSAGHQVRLRVLDHATQGVAEAVSRGEADFGICAIGSFDPTTRFRALFEDEIVPVLPNAHALASQPLVSWKALAAQALILPARNTGNRLLIDERLARARVSPIWAFEVNRSSTALDLARQGEGIALLPHAAAAGNTGVVLSKLEGPPLSRPVGLLTRVGATLSPQAQAMRDAVIDAADTLLS